MFTPLHRLLNLPASVPLSWELLQQAVDAGISEQHDLAFRLYPQGIGDDATRRELAFLVAAMANSGGGWVVLGVGCDPDTRQARTLQPVMVGSELRYQLYNVATVLHPSLLMMNVYPVRVTDALGAMLIEIPPSDRAPHMMLSVDSTTHPSFHAPKRVGTLHGHMDEYEIRRCYADSTRSYDQRIAPHHKAFEDLKDTAANYDAPAFVFTAFPMDECSVELKRVDVAKLLELTHPRAFISYAGDQHRRMLTSLAPPMRSQQSYAYIHENGTDLAGKYRCQVNQSGQISVIATLSACPHDPPRNPGEPDLPGSCSQQCVERAAAEAFALMRALQERWFISDYEVLSTIVHPGNEALSLRPADPVRVGRSVSMGDPQRPHQQVRSYLPYMATIHEQRSILRENILGHLTQTGIDTTSNLLRGKNEPAGSEPAGR